MKFLIIANKFDTAGRNILAQLLDLEPVDYFVANDEIMDSKNLDIEKIKKYDLIIFASKHKSKKHEKTLSVHSPGNFREVWGGGESGRINLSSALFCKHLFETLIKEKEKSGLKRYSVTMEATHHGPLIERPSVFIEVGGSEIEWKDKAATFVIAKTIRKAIHTFKVDKHREIAIGIGGGHYCPGFNKIQEKSNVALAHIIPKYVSPITSKMIIEAINQTVEEVDFAILDWKGLGKSEERQKIINILEENYIQWKKISEIRK